MQERGVSKRVAVRVEEVGEDGRIKQSAIERTDVHDGAQGVLIASHRNSESASSDGSAEPPLIEVEVPRNANKKGRLRKQLEQAFSAGSAG
jgi:hypothetical protein